MDKKFLSEHDSEIRSIYRKWHKNLIKNPNEPHPIISSLGEIKYPIVQSEPHLHAFDGQKIWTQVPFAGTLLVSLFNVPKEMCLRENGFEPSDIPDLIRLSKETGKIKFTLQTNPLEYEGLDYLDPIFQEFKPIAQLSDNTKFGKINENESKKWITEFFEIGSIRYLKELRYNVLKSGGNENFVNSLIDGRASTWERMKILKMDEDIENLSKVMVDEPQNAEKLFTAYIMITAPIFDPLTNHYNYSLGRLKAYSVNPYQENANIRIPEIGKLILKKLVLNPGNYYGCIETIQKYEENDLYKLLRSFEDGVSSKNPDKILESKKKSRNHY